MEIEFRNRGLSTLEGLNIPEEIEFNFSCSGNNLKNLIGGPKVVKGSYFTNYNRLETLEGIAHTIFGTLFLDSTKLLNLNHLNNVKIVQKVYIPFRKDTELESLIDAISNTELEALEYIQKKTYFGFMNKKFHEIFENYLEQNIKVKRIKKDFNI